MFKSEGSLPPRTSIETEKQLESSSAYFLRKHESYKNRAVSPQSENLNCYEIAGGLAMRLLREGQTPKLIEIYRNDGIHENEIRPLLLRNSYDAFYNQYGFSWKSHFVCCVGDTAYDTLLSQPMPIKEAIKAAFGEGLSYRVLSQDEFDSAITFYQNQIKRGMAL